MEVEAGRPVAVALGMRTEECRQQPLSSSTHRLPAGNLSPAAPTWHELNETQTLVNMAAGQEKARPASLSKWCL